MCDQVPIVIFSVLNVRMCEQHTRAKEHTAQTWPYISRFHHCIVTTLSGVFNCIPTFLNTFQLPTMRVREQHQVAMKPQYQETHQSPMKVTDHVLLRQGCVMIQLCTGSVCMRTHWPGGHLCMLIPVEQ